MEVILLPYSIFRVQDDIHQEVYCIQPGMFRVKKKKKINLQPIFETGHPVGKSEDLILSFGN